MGDMHSLLFAVGIVGEAFDVPSNAINSYSPLNTNGSAMSTWLYGQRLRATVQVGYFDKIFHE